MSSSPVVDCAVDPDLLSKMPLLDMMAEIPDPRARRGVRHQVRTVVIIALAALMSGSDCLTGFSQWARHATVAVRRRLGIDTMPSESAIRRTLQRLDPVFLDNLAGCWTWLRCQTVGGRTAISLNGKTIRGARNGGQPAPHLVSAMIHHNRAVVAQRAIDSKSNEIPALKDLLKQLVITGCVIVADALHCQVETAGQVIEQGAHYLFCAKALCEASHKASVTCSDTPPSPPRRSTPGRTPKSNEPPSKKPAATSSPRLASPRKPAPDSWPTSPRSPNVM